MPDAILVLLFTALGALCVFILVKFFRGEWRDVPKKETQKSRQATASALLKEAKKGILQKHQQTPIYQQKAIEDIFGEMEFLFSEEDIDRKIACGSIMKRLYDFKMEGKEFAELHQLICNVLAENNLQYMLEMFEKVYGCKRPAEK